MEREREREREKDENGGVDAHRMRILVDAALFNAAGRVGVESGQERRMFHHYAKIMTAPVQGPRPAGQSGRQLPRPVVHYLAGIDSSGSVDIQYRLR